MRVHFFFQSTAIDLLMLNARGCDLNFNITKKANRLDNAAESVLIAPLITFQFQKAKCIVSALVGRK